MPGGRKAAHVAADFGHDDARAQLVDAGNGGLSTQMMRQIGWFVTQSEY